MYVYMTFEIQSNFLDGLLMCNITVFYVFWEANTASQNTNTMLKFTAIPHIKSCNKIFIIQPCFRLCMLNAQPRSQGLLVFQDGGLVECARPRGLRRGVCFSLICTSTCANFGIVTTFVYMDDACLTFHSQEC